MFISSRNRIHRLRLLLFGNMIVIQMNNSFWDYGGP